SVDGFGLGPGGTDAIIPNGGIWFPGDGASDGELVIDVTTHAQAPFTVFTLKETPTPEPSSVLLLVAGAALLRRR
ncbi:MAG: PEP-CTERM sorting domain-containing protein, partial [Phycisphaerae bacterium]